MQRHKGREENIFKFKGASPPLHRLLTLYKKRFICLENLCIAAETDARSFEKKIWLFAFDSRLKENICVFILYWRLNQKTWFEQFDVAKYSISHQRWMAFHRLVLASQCEASFHRPHTNERVFLNTGVVASHWSLRGIWLGKMMADFWDLLQQWQLVSYVTTFD